MSDGLGWVWVGKNGPMPTSGGQLIDYAQRYYYRDCLMTVQLEVNL